MKGLVVEYEYVVVVVVMCQARWDVTGYRLSYLRQIISVSHVQSQYQYIL